MTFFEWFYKAVIIEGITLLLILLSILTLKYFFKSEFKKIEDFNTKYIAVDTNISEVLNNEI